MKDSTGRVRRHFVGVLLLILMAGLLEAAIYFHYDGLTAHPVAISRFLTINPVYNENGSWFHGRMGIGYVRWLLTAEHIVTLGLILYLFRFMEVWEFFLGVNAKWLYALDFAFATTLYRLLTRLRGAFTLDYLKVGKATYDLPDIYLGIGLAGMVFWAVAAMVKYRKYKREREKGMRFWEKLAWELRLSGKLLKASALPKARWPEIFDF